MTSPDAGTTAANSATVSCADDPNAPPVTIAGFEVDGNTCTNHGGLDWDTTGTDHQDPTGNADTSNFSVGSSEFMPPSQWGTGTGTASPKADMADVYSYTPAPTATAVWTIFGFTRVATSGTVTYDLEFNQAANSPAGSPKPDRTPGDLLFQITQSGNNNFTISAVAFSWTTTGCNQAGFKQVGTDAQTGWCPTVTPLGPNAFIGRVNPDGNFAEVALNLLAVDIQGATSCLGDYGTLNIRSFTSEADTAALKDWIQPVPVGITSNCASIQWSKSDQFGNPVGGVSWTVAPNPAPNGTGSFTVTDNGTHDTDSAVGTVKVSPVEPGSYTITETSVPAGYGTAPSRNVTVVAGQHLVLSDPFVDPRFYPALTVSKTAAGSYATSYDWSVVKQVRKLGDTAWSDTSATANVPQGSSATMQYRALVTAGPETRSNYVVSGTLTIDNPTTWGTYQGVNVSDALADGTACVITAPGSSTPVTTVDVPPAGVTLAYTCSYGSATPSGATGSNTATISYDQHLYPRNQADWDAAQGTPHPSYVVHSAPVSFTWAADPSRRTDATATLSDSYNGAAASTITQLTWATVWNSTDHTVAVALPSQTESGVAHTCTTYTDTALLTEDDTHAVRSDDVKAQVCVGSDLSVSKTAGMVYDRAYTWQVDKSGPGTVFTGVDANGHYVAQVTYGIDVTAVDFNDTNATVSGTITVSNPNDWEAVSTQVADAVVINGQAYPCAVNGLTGGAVSVPAAGHVDLTYSCVGIAKARTYAGTNHVTITWDAAAASTPTGTAGFDRTVTVAPPTSPADQTVTLTDSMHHFATPQTFEWNTVYDANASHTAHVTYTEPLSTSAGQCTPYTNVASLSSGQTDQVTTQVCAPGIAKTVNATYGRTYLWQIAKDVDRTQVEIAPDGHATFHYTVTATPNGYVDGSAAMSGTITLSNPSATQALPVVVSDLSGVAGWTCTVSGSTSVTVPAGGSSTVGYTCSGDATSHPDGTNTATATFGGQSVSAQVPVTFTGTTADQTVTVTDPHAPGSGTLGSATWNAQGTPASFAYDWTAPGVTAGQCQSFDNTATIVQTGQSASKTVSVCVEAPLTLTKTAAGSFDRAYKWLISKHASKDVWNVAPGGANVDYTVTTTPNGFQDSTWEVHGSITVTNPNTYAAGDIVATISDQLSASMGGTCTVTGGSLVTVPHGQSITLPYSCSFASPPASYVGTNTATASWIDPEDHAGSASSAPVDVSLQLAHETDRTVTVTDDNATPADPADDRVLGTSDYYDGPYAFTYSIHQAGVTGTCTPYTNTATLSTGQAASATVQVCVGADLTVSKSAGMVYDRAYTWAIKKHGPGTLFTGQDAQGNFVTRVDYTVDVTAVDFTDTNAVVSGAITVTNPNDWEDVTASVSDTVTINGNAYTCTVAGLDQQGRVSVPKSGQVVLDYTCTGIAKARTYSGSNLVTITWDPAAAATSGSSASDNPAVQVADPTAPANETVTLSDSMHAWDTPPTFDWNQVYDGSADHTTQVSYSEPLSTTAGACTPYTNVASLSSGDSDSVTTTLCSPGLTKTATASYLRTYQWTIDKAVDQTTVTVDPGQPAVFHYTVTATPNGYADSAATFSGTVTATNPSTTDPLTVSVADQSGVDGWTCTIDGDPSVTLAPGSSQELGYACTGDPATHPDGTNGATLTFGDGQSVSTQVPVTFTQGTADSTVTVTDPKAPDGGTLGTATWNGDGTPTAFTYDWTAPTVGPGECQSFDNTATITETGQSASQTVEACTSQHPAISLVKTASTAGPVVVGDSVTYTFLVTNTGDVTLTDVHVTDPMVGTVACPKTTLAPGESMTCTAAPHTVTAEDVTHPFLTNTATATGTPPHGPDVSATSTVKVPTATVKGTHTHKPRPHHTTPPPATLPNTGDPVSLWMLIGAGASLALGLLLLVLGTGRRGRHV